MGKTILFEFHFTTGNGLFFLKWFSKIEGMFDVGPLEICPCP